MRVVFSHFLAGPRRLGRADLAHLARLTEAGKPASEASGWLADLLTTRYSQLVG